MIRHLALARMFVHVLFVTEARAWLSPGASAFAFTTVARDPVSDRQVSMKSTVPDKYVWAPLMSPDVLKPNTVVSGVAFNQEVAIVVDRNGALYACANKAPPAGQPLTFSRPTKNGTIKDPVCGTEFDLQSGKVLPGTWLSSFLPGKLLKLFLQTPEDLPVFPVRIKNGKVEVFINANAYKQYDDQYWKGILDAQGKADGGYY